MKKRSGKYIWLFLLGIIILVGLHSWVALGTFILGALLGIELIIEEEQPYDK